MRFNTVDTKPKIYNIGVVSLFYVIYLVLSTLLIKEVHYFMDALITLIYLFTVLIFLLNATLKQIGYNPYSYNTIYYSGFSLYVIFMIITQSIVLYWATTMSDPSAVGPIVSMIAGSAGTYVMVLSPFLFLFSLALSISNFELLRHESKTLPHVLGLLLGAAIVINVILHFFIGTRFVSGSQAEVFRFDLLSNTFSGILLYFECILIGSIFVHFLVSRYNPDPDMDAIIILGCAIRRDGTPTPLLKGRVDRALTFAKYQKETTGKDVIFVPSGGKGSNEVISESECMTNYLLSQGVNRSQIVMEDQSANTFQNMTFSKKLIEERIPNAKIAYSTTNYHVFRSGIYARRVKMKAVGMGAKTKWYFWPNAAVREMIAVLTRHRVKQALVLTGIIVVLGFMTWMTYYGIPY